MNLGQAVKDLLYAKGEEVLKQFHYVSGKNRVDIDKTLQGELAGFIKNRKEASLLFYSYGMLLLQL